MVATKPETGWKYSEPRSRHNRVKGKDMKPELRPWMCPSVIMLIIGTYACQRSPDEADARQWYAKHQKTIDTIDRTIRDEVVKMPRFSKTPFSCIAKAANPSLPADLGLLASEASCSAQKLEWLEAHNRAELRFREETLMKFLDLPSVLGVSVTYQMPDTKQKNLLGKKGLCRGGFLSEAQRGTEVVEIDGRKLFWGLYQTAYQFSGGKQLGDSKERPGIEMNWSFRAEPALFDVNVAILAEGETTTEWREGWREK
jgi:hypothetical protein